MRVTTVAKQKLQGREEVVGTVRAKLRATLEAKVSGRVEAMPVKLGQRVKAGALIARLDAQEIEAKVNQTRAVLQQAQGDMKRFSALLKQQAVTQREFDGVQARYQVALASLREARTMLGYATVRAPFAGVVTHKLADVGDLASPGRPLVELEDPRALRLEVAVPEALMGFIKVGASLPIRIAATEELEGTVAEVAPAADPNSRTFLVKVDLPQDAKVRTGQFGRALVPTGRSDILKVPNTAVVVRGQMELVFVVVEDRVHLRLVKTGKRFGSEVELVSGLDGDETIVVEGANALVDLQPVELLK